MADLPDRFSGRGTDASTILTGYVVLLLAIPAPMAVSALGSAGSPATILAMGTFGLWCWYQVYRTEPADPGSRPLRTALLVWLLIMTVVYAHAMTLPLPAGEVSPADNGMLKLLGLCGVALLANDGISRHEHLRALASRLVVGAGLVAALGLLQRVTHQLFVDRLVIPGLTTGASDWVLSQRDGMVRASGTATHPIEYGVVLTMLLPLVVAYAMHAARRRWLYCGILVIVSFSIFISISRSAVVCATVALIVLAARWRWRRRLYAAGAVAVLGVAVYVLVPGMLTTLRRLFLGVGNDASINSRTGSYDLAAQFVVHHPILGRGFGTFLPAYWILDNGYLGLLIEGGVVGLVGLLAVLVTGARCAGTARRGTPQAADAALANALLAAVVAGAFSLAFFDTFAFPQSAGCLFLLLGMAGAAGRLHRPDAVVVAPPAVRGAIGVPA